MGRLSEPSSGASAPFGCRRPRSKPRGYSHRTHCGGALRYAEPGGWVLAGKGREETAGKGNNTPAAGGTITTLAATIYLPQGFPRIPEGAQVVVANEAVDTAGIATAEARQALTRSGVIRISGICQKFDPGRLHSRLWL